LLYIRDVIKMRRQGKDAPELPVIPTSAFSDWRGRGCERLQKETNKRLRAGWDEKYLAKLLIGVLN
jgi:hypothetical protein